MYVLKDLLYIEIKIPFREEFSLEFSFAISPIANSVSFKFCLLIHFQNSLNEVYTIEIQKSKSTNIEFEFDQSVRRPEERRGG